METKTGDIRENVPIIKAIPVEAEVVQKIVGIIDKHIDKYSDIQKEYDKEANSFGIRICDNKINALINVRKEIGDDFPKEIK